MEALAVSKPSVRFEVERVIGVSDDGNYQVQWRPAWVSKFHLDGCEHLIQEFLQQQAEKEREDKLLPVLGESNKIQSTQDALTGRKSVQKLQTKIAHTEDSKRDNMHDSFSSVDSLLSDAMNTSIKIEEEEEMVEVDTDSSLVFLARKEDVPQWNVTQHTHSVITDTDVIIGTNCDNNHHGIAKDGLPSPTETHKEGHSYSHNHVTLNFDKSKTLTDLYKNGIDSYHNFSSTIGDKAPSFSAFPHVHANSLSKSNGSSSIATLNRSDASKEAITKHSTVTHWMINEAPSVSTEGDSNKKHICTVCQKQFNHKGHLRDHFRVHTGVKPFVCEYCNKAFAQSGNLNQHVRTHSGEKFVCQLCGKSFSRRNTLDKHIQTHTNSREFVCNVCQKSFWLEEAFEKHLRIHSSQEST